MNTTPSWRGVAALPRAHGAPLIACRIRAYPEDFRVEEELPFAPDGDGDHRLLLVRKTDSNTEWAARRIAALAGVPAKEVGYAGLKDRRAVTSQWFSVPLGRRPDPDWAELAADGIDVLERHAHRRKLRRGTLARNRFSILLRDVVGDTGGCRERLGRLAEAGVPNYFGPQRFGHDDGNLHRADALFNGRVSRVSRHQRGLWLSAARSQLFNELLARRVERGDWDQPLPGERLQLAGSHSHFLAEEVDAMLCARHRTGDVQPTGPLFGAGEALTGGIVSELEAAVAAEYPRWVDGLARAGLRQERRPLRLNAAGLQMEQPAPDQLLLRFALPPGSYATALLRELAHWSEAGTGRGFAQGVDEA